MNWKRKIIGMLCCGAVLLGLSLPVSAAVVSGELLPLDTEPLLPRVNEQNKREGYLFTIDGQTYRVGISKSRYTLPKKYDPENPIRGASLKAGDYYMYRSTAYDGFWPRDWTRPAIDGFQAPITFYDLDMNFVSEHKFDTHIRAIGYKDGVYYCDLVDGRLMRSTDRENWEETDEELPREVGGLYFTDTKVALDGGAFQPVTYEEDVPREFWSTLGNWIFKRYREDPKDVPDGAYPALEYYLSNDNVYFATLEMPENCEELDWYQELNGMDMSSNQNYDLQCIYEYEDKIVMDMRKDVAIPNLGYLVRLTVPKQEVYAELEAQKSAPYVCVNNTILGFETPPVTEADRTLVPMRFLFEQLGADVTWDEATETATAVKADTTINFAINNTTATVNGAEAVMDVPARLVGDKTMVPLRFLSEEMGYNVEWDEETRMATVITSD